MGCFKEVLADGCDSPLQSKREARPEVDQSNLKQIAILGSTGSIGRQTLAVVEAMPGRFGVVALAAGNNVEELAQQIARHHPELVSVATPAVADR